MKPRNVGVSLPWNRTHRGRFDTVLVDGIDPEDVAVTGKLDQWEIERIAQLEAEEAAIAD